MILDVNKALPKNDNPHVLEIVAIHYLWWTHWNSFVPSECPSGHSILKWFHVVGQHHFFCLRLSNFEVHFWDHLNSSINIIPNPAADTEGAWWMSSFWGLRNIHLCIKMAERMTHRLSNKSSLWLLTPEAWNPRPNTTSLENHQIWITGASG